MTITADAFKICYKFITILRILLLLLFSKHFTILVNITSNT